MKLSNLALRGARRVYDLVMPVLQPVTPSVRILLVKDGATLLVHHTYASKWYFPGGGVKRGETLAAAAAREAREEAGALVHSQPRILGIYYYQHLGRSDHVVVYVSEDFDLTQPTDTWEIEGLAWFGLDKLPPNMHGGCRRRIGEYLSGRGPFQEPW